MIRRNKCSLILLVSCVKFHFITLFCTSKHVPLTVSGLKTFLFAAFNNLFEQELGLYKAQTKLPFNAFGTMAMARDVRI